MSAKIPMFCAICDVPIKRRWSGDAGKKKLILTCGRKCGAELQRRNGGYAIPKRIANPATRKQYQPKTHLCDCGRKRITSEICSLCQYELDHPVGSLREAACQHCSCLMRFIVKRGAPRKSCDNCKRKLLRIIRQRTRFNRESRKRCNGPYEIIDPPTIFERDSFTCMICLQLLDMTAKSPHPMSPSIDHTIPLARGGTHTYDNVQSAHLICNSIKSDRIDFANIM